MQTSTRQFYEFGSFRVDPYRHRLLRKGQPVSLPTKSFETLLVLVQNPGKLMTRQDLLSAVWADAFVEDANLTVAISVLRKSLGQETDSESYIETVPRVGYRFLGDVELVTEQPGALVVEKHRVSRTVIEEDVPDSASVSNAVTNSLKSVYQHRSLRIAAGVALVAVAIISYFYLRRTDHAALASPSMGSIRSIAVLPPRSLSIGNDDPSLRLGVADALVTRLGGLRNLSVRPTAASVRYLNSNEDPIEIGRALHVDAVLDGSMQRENGHLRITLRMLSVADGTQLWSATVDESDKDIFKLQDLLSQQVANQLFGELSNSEKQRIGRQQSHSTEAYSAYTQGMYFWNRRGDQASKSLPYFRRAIELDPNFAEAYVGLATVDACTQIPSPEAEALIERALQLNNSLAEAHASSGLIKMFHHWDWRGAEGELNKALELDSSSVSAHHWKGIYLSLQGRFADAQAELDRALTLDPTSSILLADIGQLHYLNRKYDEAIEYCNRSLAIDPESQMTQLYLFNVYAAKGMETEALKHSVLFELGNADSERTKTVLADKLRIGLAQALKEKLADYVGRDEEQQSILALQIARIYLLLKNYDQAMRWLERAPERPNFFVPYIAVDPLYDPLRSNPRFQGIVRKIGLS